jgi:CheY-like chemotaxis protein
MEAVGRLAGGIAHDFNNLLTAILGHIELMELKFKSGDPLFKDVEVIHKAAERAAALTGQLLAFSRKQALLPKVLNLNSLIEDLNKILRRVIGEDIEFKSILYPNLPNVKVDPNQMEMVIMNLVINARDAMSSADKLTIETGLVDLDKDYCSTHTDVTPGKYVSLAVSDTGVGMPPEVMEKAFEPFFTTKEVGKGTGLGLSTVHGIVKQSGGNVTIYSEVGKGTTVTIYLPITSDDTDGKMGAGGLPPLPMGNETILLVEDEESVRSMTANALVKQGFQVLTADNGVNAVLLVEKINPQIEILVTDIVMPKMNGKQLWNCLKEKYPQLKVLFMSGYTANAVSEIEVKDIQLPFIQKPFKSSDLVRKVRKVLDS